MAERSSTQEENESLLGYRLQQVERKVDTVSEKLDKLDNIKKADLIDFRDTIVDRVNEIRDSLQKQVDGKADQKQVDDLRTLIKAVGSILGSIIAGLAIYFITTRH